MVDRNENGGEDTDWVLFEHATRWLDLTQTASDSFLDDLTRYAQRLVEIATNEQEFREQCRLHATSQDEIVQSLDPTLTPTMSDYDPLRIGALLLGELEPYSADMQDDSRLRRPYYAPIGTLIALHQTEKGVSRDEINTMITSHGIVNEARISNKLTGHFITWTHTRGRKGRTTKNVGGNGTKARHMIVDEDMIAGAEEIRASFSALSSES